MRSSSKNQLRGCSLKPPFRVKSISTRVSDAEYAALEARASADKQTLSEWMRAKLLEPSGGDGAADEVLLAELLGLRTILINLLFSIGKGEAATAEQMQALIERADADKMRRALEKLGAVRVAVPAMEPEAGLEAVPGGATAAEPEAEQEG